MYLLAYAVNDIISGNTTMFAIAKDCLERKFAYLTKKELSPDDVQAHLRKVVSEIGYGFSEFNKLKPHEIVTAVSVKLLTAKSKLFDGYLRELSGVPGASPVRSPPVEPEEVDAIANKVVGHTSHRAFQRTSSLLTSVMSSRYRLQLHQRPDLACRDDQSVNEGSRNFRLS